MAIAIGSSVLCLPLWLVMRQVHGDTVGVDFQAYVPSVLPEKATVSSKKLTRVRTPDGSKRYVVLEMAVTNYKLTIGEEKARDTAPLACPEQSAADSVERCEERISPLGIRYQVSYDDFTHYSRPISGYTVKTVKNGTLVYLNVLDDYAPDLQSYDWGAVVDSLQPDTLTDVSITDGAYPR